MKRIIVLIILMVINMSAEEREYSLVQNDYANVPNSDDVCKAYVNALNTHPPVVDYFEAPFHPNSKNFTYPKWEEMDIMENKEVYLKVISFLSNKNVNKGRYFYIKPITEKNSLPPYIETLKSFNKSTQMYKIKTDINNDGEKELVVMLAFSRYGFYTPYRTKLTVLKDNRLGEYKYIDSVLSMPLSNEGIVYDLFYYKDRVYVKETFGYRDFNKLIQMSILQFNSELKLDELCFIESKEVN